MSTFIGELLGYDDCNKECIYFDKSQNGCMYEFGCIYYPDEFNDQGRKEYENNKWF